MKKKNILELSEHLKKRFPFRVIYDGDDFGIYKYNSNKDRYEGIIGHIDLKEMVMIIKSDGFIELEIA